MQKNILSTNPLVYTCENFFKKSECQHICNVAYPQFNTAYVSSGKSGVVSKGRTGKNCWLTHTHDPIIQSICERISDLVEIPLNRCESMQVIYYDKEQEYRNHYDAYTKNSDPKNIRCLRKGGNRVVTCLGYLNEVEEGGETAFSALNIKVAPKLGKLLVFYNCNEDFSRPHVDTIHAGCPVVKGQKFAFNLWFREYNVHVPYEYSFPLNTHSIPASTVVDYPSSVCTMAVSDTMKRTVVSTNPLMIYLDNFISMPLQEQMLSMCKNGNMTTKGRMSYWLKNNELSAFVESLSKCFSLPSSYFENINIIKYPKNTTHGLHFDAFKGEPMEQRMYTIAAVLKSDSTPVFKFPKTDIQFSRASGYGFLYKNTKEDSSIRNELTEYEVFNMKDETYVMYLYFRTRFQLTPPSITEIDACLSSTQSEFMPPMPPIEETKIVELEDYSNTLQLFYDSYKNDSPKQIKSFVYKNYPIQEQKNVLNTIFNCHKEGKPVVTNNETYEFSEFKPVIANNVFDNEIITSIQQYYNDILQRKLFVLGDNQSNRYKAYNEIVSRILHYELVPMIERIVKHSVKPTYTYTSFYTKGADLPAHTDREDCEYTVSFIVNKPAGLTWPIYFDLTKQPEKHKGRSKTTPEKETCLSLDCDANAFMIFQGTDHLHFREPLEGDFYHILLLHYRSV